MTNDPREWKMRWDFDELISLVVLLIEKTKDAERESQYHELWSEILTFLCKALKKQLVRFSVVPQLELGYQGTPPEFLENTQGPPRLTRANLNAMGVGLEQVGAEGVILPDGPVGGIMEPSSAITAEPSDSAGDSSMSIDSSHRENRVPQITWCRLDWLVIGRVYRASPGGMIGRLASAEVAEVPVMIVEIKKDPDLDLDSLALADEPTVDESDSELESTDNRVPSMEFIRVVPQVLLYAQYAFEEYDDARESICGLVTIGTRCVDFTILRSKLPPLSEKAMYSSKLYISDNTALELAQNHTENIRGPYDILNKEGDNFSDTFLAAWSRARSIHDDFVDYPEIY